MEIVHEYTCIVCGECGVSFCVLKSYASSRKGDHRAFKCPNGHDISLSIYPTQDELMLKVELLTKENAALKMANARLLAMVDQLEAKISLS